MTYKIRELSNIPIETINKWKEASKTVADLVGKNVVIITRDRPDFFVILISKNKLVRPPAIDKVLGENEDFTYTLEWPDGKLFGAIILMDKELDYDLSVLEKLFRMIKDMIESDLELIVNKRNLAERGKELACIYQIRQLHLENDMKLEDLFLEITRILPRHFSYPELARCRIIFNNLIISQELDKPTDRKLVEEVKLSEEDYLRIEIFYAQNRKMPDIEIEFLSEEQELLKSVTRYAVTYIRQINIAQKLLDISNRLNTNLYSIGDRIITVDIDGLDNNDEFYC